MSKQVVLYVRVSMDEQAEKNLSLPSQVERLEKHCRAKGWTILKVFEEDYSAWHGFNRPAYTALRAYLQENKKQVDYLLFVQWSRFSRNTAQAHSELEALKKWEIEANATEQWVDMRIPESRYMLAFYLTAPQVENERLSLRVKDALWQGLKQGKWMGKAPYGYLIDKEAKLMIPDPATKDFVSFAFDTFAIGIYSIAEMLRMAKERGADLRKQRFIDMLSNPLYIGKIYIKALEDEPAQFVNGIHTPIVSEEVFNSVQSLLKGKRKPYKGKTKGEDLPLKGYLICPECGRPIGINRKCPF